MQIYFFKKCLIYCNRFVPQLIKFKKQKKDERIYDYRISGCRWRRSLQHCCKKSF
jgi:hypothetical protein